MTVVETRPAPGRWHPASWRDHPAAQQPPWPDPGALRSARESLELLPGLVTADEVWALRRELGRVAHGRGFVIQAGDCAESFAELSTKDIADRVALSQEMCAIVAERVHVPVIPIGRIAGQFAKPRSQPTESVDGVTLPSFFGHLVNDVPASLEARRPDAARLVQGHAHAARTLSLLRSTARDEYAMRGHWGRDLPAVFVSHEALVLDYEQPQVHLDGGSWVLTSTHLPWIGERTRQPDGAHVAFLSGVVNPVGCKIGPGATPAEVVELCARLDPDRQPGRLVLIARMGAHLVGRRLPALVRAVADAGHPVIWVCDPMHGNTIRVGSLKTRRQDAVCAEIEGFFTAVRAAGSWPGGVHLECTSDNVTECLGGEVGESDLPHRYTTHCDPRLNRDQTLAVARFTADLAAG